MNLLQNAGFLDGAAGWTSGGDLTLSIDEAVMGSPGRAVLLASGVTSAPNQVRYLQGIVGFAQPVAAGQLVEAEFMFAATINGAVVVPSAQIAFANVGGSLFDGAVLKITAPELVTHGVMIGGLRQTFYRAFGRAVVPDGAVKAVPLFTVTAPANGSAVVLSMLKPRVGVTSPTRAEPLSWDPGSHAEEDLQLPCWPTTLRPFQRGGGSQAKPNRAEFEIAVDRPASRRTAIDPARRFDGVLRCDAVQREVLEKFARANPGDFWFVEPDSDRLCVASFAADGAPLMVEERGPTCLMGVGLWLETA